VALGDSLNHTLYLPLYSIEAIASFSKLSKEDKAQAFGAFLTNFSPSTKTKLLIPDLKDLKNIEMDSVGKGIEKVELPKVQVSDKARDNSSKGDFTTNPRAGEISKMSDGGHGQENIDFLS
jgi:hypothetical protein